MIYREYSKFLVEEFGEKVYKLPIKLNLTCPNRDGLLGFGGCTFCGEEGGSFENFSGSITEQLNSGREKISKRFKAKKYIAYFQNFTNTYIDLESFKENIYNCLDDDIVGISISTRPDCLPEEYLKFLSKFTKDRMITLEIGLQTTNYKTLKKINRGHGISEFVDAVIRAHNHGIRVCTHLILNLPWDDIDDTIESAHLMNALGVEEVKLHSLYIVKNTIMGAQYERGEFEIISLEEYEKRVIEFLRNLDSEIVVQRLVGRAPEEDSLFCNWNTSWWKIRDQIIEEMQENNFYQGQLIERK